MYNFGWIGFGHGFGFDGQIFAYQNPDDAFLRDVMSLIKISP